MNNTQTAVLTFSATAFAAGLLHFAAGPWSAEAAAERPDSAPAAGLDDLRANLKQNLAQHDRVIDLLESLRDGLAVRTAVSAAAPEPGPEEAAPPAHAPPAAAGDEPTIETFGRLLAGVLRESSGIAISAEEQARFWKLARTTDLVPRLIDDLESIVAQAPHDLDSRMELADAYVARLMTIPGGAEQGIWGQKAERQWQSVLDRNPDHWDAQYSLAFNYSMYPAFLDKSGDAIAGFEECVRIQQYIPAEERHLQTYRSLARLYQRRGDAAEARRILELGRARHPEDAGIVNALQRLERNAK